MAKHLPDQVADASGGRLRLVDTLDRGRSLEAAVDLPVGHRWRDTPVLPHGSNLGKYLIQACPDCEEDEHFSSDFVAALDFLASLLLQGCQSDVLSKLYSFTKEATEVPMIQHWHKRWRSDLTERITVAELEEAWIHVVPNWRQLKVSCPVVRRAAVNGVDVPLLSHDVVCGLWLQMALCEHSCDPNCSLVHDGEDLWFITVRPIPAGSAVTTSYLNMESLMKPTSLRREELREVWGFDCACSRCAKDDIEFLPQKHLRRLLVSCSLRPADLGEASTEERQEFQRDLRILLEQVQKLHGPNPHPVQQALMLLESVFAPAEAQEEACWRHLEICTELFGAESRCAKWARELCQSPEICADELRLHAPACQDLEEGRTMLGASRNLIMKAYARHFSKQWRLQRRGAEFIACS